MKYVLDVEIDVPRTRVIELFDDHSNLKEWQPDFIRIEPISGEPGQPGEKTRQWYKMGKREIEMIETITVRNPPEEYSATYEAKHIWNRVDCRFTELGEDRTRWHMEIEFKCRGMMRIMAVLAPSMFKKESLASMQRFKEFAESA